MKVLASYVKQKGLSLGLKYDPKHDTWLILAEGGGDGEYFEVRNFAQLEVSINNLFQKMLKYYGEA